ncbi:MAG: cytochrome c nitrite reductase small subunit [bacterium]|jgi:cytochrome c nitrite reductase small subunit
MRIRLRGQPNWPKAIFGRTFAVFPLWVWMCFGGLIGLITGIGLFTFTYAQGLSYLSNDPKSCLNCHVMRDVYEGWNHSSHKSVATCNDCHIPHNFPAKYIAKGINGWHHSYAFTTGKFHEPIRIKKYNRDILLQNCLHCHGSLTDPIIHKNSDQTPDCLHCHSRVGHDW